MGTIVIEGILVLILLYLILKDGTAIQNILADATLLTQQSIDSLEGR